MSRTIPVRTRLGHLAAALLLALSALAGLPRLSSAASTINVGPAVAIDSSDSTCSLLEAFELIDEWQGGNTVFTNDCGSSNLSTPITVSLTGTHTYTITDTDYTGAPWNMPPSGNAFPVLSGASTQVVVDGNGATIERASGATEAFRFFTIEDGAELTIQELTLRNGWAEDASAGAILSVSSTLTVIDSTFDDNQADNYSGAIGPDGSTVTITNTTFSGNSAGWDGGAIAAFSGGTLTVTGSTFSQNQASDGGGAIRATNAVTITGSTFSQNQADEGGAIWTSGTLTMTSSTLSGNTVTGEGSALYLAGNAVATLSFVTVADHTGAAAFDVGLIVNSATLNLKNVVLADPSVDECASVGSGLTVQTAGAVLADDPSCGSGVTVVSNLRTTLGNLQFNGGPTQTHALLSGSPAIGAVPAGQCTDWDNVSVTTDQRGQPRPNPSGSPCDAGAYESELGPSATPTPAPVDLAVSRLSVTRYSLENYDFTVTVTNTGSSATPSSTVVLRLNRTGSPTAGEVTATRTVPALAPGQSYSFTVRRTIRDLAIKYVVAVVDPANTLAETDEANNVRVRKFR